MSAVTRRHRHATSTRQRFLAEAVVAMTGRLVSLAMNHAWADIPRTLSERRGLLEDLEREPRAGAHEASCIAALRSAVAESERVLMQLRPTARRLNVSGTGDTVILHHELAYADVLPVSFRPLPGPLDTVSAGAMAERNLRVLLACAALDEHGKHDKAADDAPHAADIQRIDLKVNLLLDMVGALLAASQSRPSAVPARFNPHGIVWDATGAVPAAGTHGIVEIHLRDCLVHPVSLEGTVAEGPADRHVHVRFDPLPEPVADQLERLVFRRHRRQVAGGRTQRRA